VNFASVAELATFTGRELAENDPAALLALNLASDLIRAETGNNISRETSTVTIDGEHRPSLLLPNGHLVVIHEVIEDGVTLTADQYTVTPYGVLTRLGGRWSGKQPANITVEYSHGHDPVPGLIKLICLAVADRISSTLPTGIKNETVGGYSVAYAQASSTLLESEIRALDPFRNAAAY
jgi:hypothetical protein